MKIQEIVQQTLDERPTADFDRHLDELGWNKHGALEHVWTHPEHPHHVIYGFPSGFNPRIDHLVVRHPNGEYSGRLRTAQAAHARVTGYSPQRHTLLSSNS